MAKVRNFEVNRKKFALSESVLVEIMQISGGEIVIINLVTNSLPVSAYGSKYLKERNDAYCRIYC
jgi:hypothetical protein